MTSEGVNRRTTLIPCSILKEWTYLGQNDPQLVLFYYLRQIMRNRTRRTNNWPASSVWVFIAQLGEHCSANAEATGSNPVEAPKVFFSGYFRNCLNCDSLRWSHTHFICIPAVHIITFRRTNNYT